MIEFDVETTGLQPYSGVNEAFLWIFSSEPDCSDAETVVFSPTKAAVPGYGIVEWVHEQWIEARDRIQWWFDRGKTEGIRAHNAKFDRGFAVAAGFDLPGDDCWHDSMLVAQTIDERRSNALKNLAVSLFGPDAADPQKALKSWLHDENQRRIKVCRAADNIDVEIEKANQRVGFCAAKAAAAKGEKSRGSWRDKQAVAEENFKKAKTQKEALLEEAALYRRDDGTFNYANYSDVPMEIMEPYALEDVRLTRAISDTFENILERNEDLKQTIEFERKAMDAIFAIEKRGLPADMTSYRRLEQEVIGNLGHLEDRVTELAQEADPVAYAKAMGVEVEVSEDGVIRSYKGTGGRLEDFNPKSSDQIIAALKARGADLRYMSKEEGKLSADADNLRAVDDELAGAILNYRSEYKVLSTYVRPMLKRTYVPTMNTYKEPFISAADYRVHATYRQVGARTGRMSCADPNMQNQPRDDLRLRYNIQAEPGMKLITCDLTNIEMVLFAAYCGEGALLTAVKNGDDLHELTARMLGFRDRKRPGGGYESARQQGKVYNFTTIYGGGLRSVRRYFRCDMATAQLYRERYFKAYPEVGKLKTIIKHRLEDHGYIQDKLVSGRRFRVDPRDDYKAINYVVQGTAAALLKYAVIKLHEDGVPMVALVHDEILAYAPENDALEVAKLVQTRMTEYEKLKGVVPLRAEYDIVDRWSDAKPLKETLLGPDGEPILGDDDEPLTRAYLFDPDWAKVERRYLPAAA